MNTRSFLVLIFPVVALFAPLKVAAQSATLSVNAAQVVRTVDERVFGLNAVMWDGLSGSTQTISLLQAAGVRTIRVPGGSASDEYHWRTNTSLANTWTWSAGFDAFTKLITGLNAQTFATVNYGTGTPEEAAGWVAYANAGATIQGTGGDVAIGVDVKGYDWKTAGYWSNLRNSAPLATNDGSNFLRIGRAAPVGIKYWEIGNENYGTWEADQQAVTHDPYTYAVRAKDYITKMKAVDPTIKIGVVVVTGENSSVNNTSHPATNPRTSVVHNGWTPVLLTTLRTLGVTPDYVIYHRYEQAPAADNPGNPEGDAKLLQSAKTWPQDAADLRQQLTDYLGAAGAGVELIVTENNSVYAKPGKQTTSLVNALFMADSVGNILQTEFNSLVWWDLRNGQETGNNNNSALYGWRGYGDYGILSGTSEPYPTYYALKLLASFARGGDTIVQASSNNTLLSLYAAKRSDGRLSLLVINKDPANTLSASFALAGFTPAATATTYSYGKPQDTAAQTGSGSKDIETATMSISGSAFTASFAPYSVTVISIPVSTTPIAPTITTQPTASSGAGGRSVTYTVNANGNPAPTYQWQRLPAGAALWENINEGGSYRGVTTSSLSIDTATVGMSGDQFRAVVSNASGTVTTTAAMLTVSGTSLLQYPAGIALDSLGNLYVADSASNAIRKISVAGVVSTLAGTVGTSGSADGSGGVARFNQPSAITADSSGTLYVADTGNAIIRKITAAGVVSTLAGSASVRGSADGTGASATFSAPSGIAVNASGVVFVADTFNATIRKISSVGVVSTFAGSAGERGDRDGIGTMARFNYPNGLCVDTAGNLYVSDTYNNIIRKIAPDATVTTIAGLAGVSGTSNGDGAGALFSQPYGVAYDPSSSARSAGPILYVADTSNSMVRKLSSPSTVTTQAGMAGIAGLANGAGSSAWFNQPRALVVDGSGIVYVADTGNAIIRKINSSAVVSTVALTEAVDPTPTPTPTPPPPAAAGASSGGGGGALDGGWIVALVILALGRRAFVCSSS